MSLLTKAFISGAAGAFIAAKIEPMVLKQLPSVAAGSFQAQGVHLGVAGASAAGIFYLLGGK